MARQRNPKRGQALKMWLESGRTMMLKDVAESLDVKAGLVRKWKHVDKWDDIPDTQPKRRGAPYRNKNAVGNKGGAPRNNKNAEKHGMFSKWLPDDDELKEIYEATRAGMNNLDILYEEILVMFTNFIRAQKIMYVEDINDITKEIKKEKSYSDKKATSHEIEYDIQYAWDKQAKALTSQAAASRAISTKIKQYEEMLRTLPPEEIKESHRLRVKKMKADIKATEAKAW